MLTLLPLTTLGTPSDPSDILNEREYLQPATPYLAAIVIVHYYQVLLSLCLARFRSAGHFVGCHATALQYLHALVVDALTRGNCTQLICISM